MFEVEKTFIFDAGHVLKNHDGKCSQPHGHTYTMTVKVRSKELIKEGSKKNMVIDFYDISAVVKPMIEKYFDHCWINDSLGTDSPSSEFMAKWAFDYLEPHLPGLYQVSISENPSSKATYERA